MYSNELMFLLVMPSNQPFQSPFNMISIAGIALHTLVVARSGNPLASFAVINNNLLLTEYA